MSEVTDKKVWQVLGSVMDPEIPVLSVVDLGIVTKLVVENNHAAVTITPTFVGCPALDVIKKNVEEGLDSEGISHEVTVDFSIPWTSNRMTEEGKRKLEEFGLAPPPALEKELTKQDLDKVSCPNCGSSDTTLRSPFGSTLCRAIRFCFQCKQGFEQFKPI